MMTCGHNEYWKANSGNCMVCRAEKAESSLAAERAAHEQTKGALIDYKHLTAHANEKMTAAVRNGDANLGALTQCRAELETSRAQLAAERMVRFPEWVRNELNKARVKHKGANSPHEGYAIIREELDEFWDEVKAQHHNKQRMLEELVQVAAMCQRVAEDVLMNPHARSAALADACEDGGHRPPLQGGAVPQIGNRQASI